MRFCIATKYPYKPQASLFSNLWRGKIIRHDKLGLASKSNLDPEVSGGFYACVLLAGLDGAMYMVVEVLLAENSLSFHLKVLSLLSTY